MITHIAIICKSIPSCANPTPKLQFYHHSSVVRDVVNHAEPLDIDALRFTNLTQRRLLHSPLLSFTSSPSSQLGFCGLAFILSTVWSTTPVLSCASSQISYTHLSPSVSTSTPVIIRSSTHSLLQRSSAHFFSLHSHPFGGRTSSKKRVPPGLSPAMRGWDRGS